ncbi:YcxB family protein [Adhaeribacter rhizoryzae]|uniref:YcxB family protein n=1 Tax=Adhaeribacter rhizoryzae TaxID=2607907 RepID=A0A5M6D5W3_9BACT|nr:YcxB family protein [Adhaeribacter rhizoryzae]KAA5540595.1 YcxB family protein [Adhaeribacter rhizoryzae]
MTIDFMTIEYTVTEEDFMTYQLYMATKSEVIKKRRQRNKIWISILYVALGVGLYYKDNSPFAIIFVIIGVLWFFFYPVYEKKRYYRHYKSFFRENLKERLGRLATLTFTDDFIMVKENGSESKLLTKEIEEIYDIPSIFIVKLKIGQAYILPKNQIKEVDLLKTRLEELARFLNIPYSIETEWVWK